MSDAAMEHAQAYYSALCDVEDSNVSEVDWRNLARHAARLWAVGGEAAVHSTFREWLHDIWEES